MIVKFLKYRLFTSTVVEVMFTLSQTTFCFVVNGGSLLCKFSRLADIHSRIFPNFFFLYRSVQTEKNVVDWLNGDHVRKLALEESSCLDSSDFDVSSISDLGSPLLLTEQRMSPCGQDFSPDGESGDFYIVSSFS